MKFFLFLLFSILLRESKQLIGKEFIVGGELAPKYQYRYYVSLQCKKQQWEHVCSGAIINPNWVLSAAHCSTHCNQSLKVIAGIITSKSSSDELQEKFVKNIYIPSTEVESINFNPQNNIMLLRLLEPFEFNNAVGAAYLPQNTNDCKIKEGIVAGMGKALWWLPRGYLHLVFLRLPVIPYQQCLDMIRFISDKNIQFDSKVLCTGLYHSEGLKNNGDGGAALVEELHSSSKVYYKIYGVTSRDFFSSDNQKELVFYTSVCEHLQWIYNTVEL